MARVVAKAVVAKAVVKEVVEEEAIPLRTGASWHAVVKVHHDAMVVEWPGATRGTLGQTSRRVETREAPAPAPWDASVEVVVGGQEAEVDLAGNKRARKTAADDMPRPRVKKLFRAQAQSLLAQIRQSGPGHRRQLHLDQ